MNKTLRAFIAVPIPEAVTVFLQQVQRRLDAQRMNIRWVAAKNIHLTLKFLGEIEAPQLSAVTSQMDAATATMAQTGFLDILNQVGKGFHCYSRC